MDDSGPPSSSTEQERPLSFAAAALWTLIAIFLTTFIVRGATALRDGADPDLVSFTASWVIAYSLVFFVILRVHEPRTSIRQVLALRLPFGKVPAGLLALVLAAVLGASLSVPRDWFDRFVEARFPQPPSDNAETYEQLLSIATVGKRIALVATLGVVKPAFDELFFRGALFTPLLRKNRIELVIVGSAAFEVLCGVVMDLSPRAAAPLFVVGAVFAWMRGITGSTWPSIVARMAFVGISVVSLVLGRDGPKPTNTLLLESALAIAVGVAGLHLLSRRAAKVAA